MSAPPRTLQSATKTPAHPRPASDKQRSSTTTSAGSTGTVTGDVRQATALPDARTRQMLSSFTAGVSAKNLAAVEAEGGIEAWFEHQLSPGDIPDRDADDTWTWWDTLAMTPQQKHERYKAGIETGWQMMQSLASWVMMRRLISNKPVEEMMVDFWSNHLHVCSPCNDVWVWRVEYEKVVREHALGRFDELLIAAIQHPAMGIFLSNTFSTSEAINENLGRELLELHTLGVGNYTEDDVINSARILTGFHVDHYQPWIATYVPADHWVGRVKVKGFTSNNKNPNGIPVLTQYLKYLATHPLTAKRICTKLAVRFMSDKPSKALISSLTKVYLDNNTAIVPVLRALVASNEFKATFMQKVRTPVEDALATWTVVGLTVTRPRTDQSAANQMIDVSKAIGQVVYDWPTPDAFPDLGPAWCNAGRLLGSMRIHWSAASANWPNEDVIFKPTMDWMPQLPAMFSDVVDYVVRNTLFLPSTPAILQAACTITDIGPNDMITPTHALIKTKFPRLMVSILDTVEHMSR